MNYIIGSYRPRVVKVWLDCHNCDSAVGKDEDCEVTKKRGVQE